MAKSYRSKARTFLSVAAVLLSVVLVLHVAESRVLPKRGDSVDGKETFLVCTETYGAEDGDTCFTIANTFNLTTDYFNFVNPNLDCDQIFVSQWLCVDAVVF